MRTYYIRRANLKILIDLNFLWVSRDLAIITFDNQKCVVLQMPYEESLLTEEFINNFGLFGAHVI